MMSLTTENYPCFYELLPGVRSTCCREHDHVPRFQVLDVSTMVNAKYDSQSIVGRRGLEADAHLV